MNKLKQTYMFHPGPHMGRFGKAERKGYILCPNPPKKRKLFLKEIDISTKPSKQAYTREVNANTKTTKSFPTKCLKTWITSKPKKHGYILSQYMDNIKWMNLPKKYEQLAIQNLAKQLKHIHSRGFSHGDLTQKNCPVNSSGQTSIIDFEDAFPLTRQSKQSKKYKEQDWNMFRLMFFPFSRSDRKNPKMIRLFNYAQVVAPNDGCVLQMTSLKRGESRRGYAYKLFFKHKPTGRIYMIKQKTGQYKNSYCVDNIVVDPKYCTKMLRSIEMFGVGSFYLKVNTDDHDRIACYEKTGFKIDIENSSTTTLVMTKSLGS